MKSTLKQMRKTLKLALFALFAAVSFTASAVVTPVQPSGDGTETNPYHLTTAAELLWFRDKVNGGYTDACAYLMNDIDLTGAYTGDWVPISENRAYEGTFRSYKADPYGHGEVIVNYRIKGIQQQNRQEHCGLFYMLDSDATVRNIDVEVNIDTDARYVGALTGYNNGAAISSVSVYGKVRGKSHVGGVIGIDDYSGVSDDYALQHLRNYAEVRGEDNVGGIVGYSRRVQLCANYGDVIAPNAIRVGGIAGYGVNVADCLSAGSVVEGGHNVGGVVGSCDDVRNCYVMTIVKANAVDKSYGLICGKISTNPASINCYYHEKAGDYTGAPDVKLYNNGEEKPIKATYDSDCGSDLKMQSILTAYSGQTCVRLMGRDRQYTEVSPGPWENAKWVQDLRIIGNSTHAHFPRPAYDAADREIVVYGIGEWLCDGTFKSGTTFTNNSTGTNGELYYDQNTYLPLGEHSFDTNGFCSRCKQPQQPGQNAGGYYELANVGNLVWLRDAVNSQENMKFKAVLTDNINLSSVCGPTKGNWTPIVGAKPADLEIDFNGQGYSISGLYIASSDNTPCGLFGSITGHSGTKRRTIKRLRLTNVSIAAPNLTDGVGALAGQMSYADVSDVEVLPGSVSGYRTVGGLIGSCSNVTITHCTNRANVESSIMRAAGIVAHAGDANCRVSQCTNLGNVQTGTNGGGIVARSAGAIDRCANYGSVKTSFRAGGVVAYFEGESIVDCANYGDVTSADEVGGIAGATSMSVTKACALYNAGNLHHTSEDGRSCIGAIIGQANDNAVLTDSYFSTYCTYLLRNNPISIFALGSSSSNNTSVEGFNAQRAASGEIAYLLQNYPGRNLLGDEGTVWMQNLAVNGAQPTLNNDLNGSDYQVFRHNYVNCKGESVDATYYSNSRTGDALRYNEEGYADGHLYEGTACKFCGHPVAEEPAQDADGYYLIASASHLLWFADHVNSDGACDSNARLTADLDLANVCNATVGSWRPIGGQNGIQDTPHGYCGTFDGQGHTITGLYINAHLSFQGLFGTAYNDNGTLRGATIRNLTLSGDVTAEGYSALLAGSVSHGTVENVITCGSLTLNSSEAKRNFGTICGYGGHDTHVSDCRNFASISVPATGGSYSHSYVGGLIGYATGDFTLERSMNYGEVSAPGADYVGGLAGSAQGRVDDSANCGAVNGKAYVGGLFGNALGNLALTRCFNAGELRYTSNYDGITNNSGKKSLQYTNCTILKDQYNGSTQPLSYATPDDFATGRIAYGLHTLNPAWGQNLGGSDLADRFPALGAKEVYRCDANLSMTTLDYQEQKLHSVLWRLSVPAGTRLNIRHFEGIEPRYSDRMAFSLGESEANLQQQCFFDYKAGNPAGSYVSAEGELSYVTSSGDYFFRIDYLNGQRGQKNPEIGDGGVSVYLNWYANSPAYSLVNLSGVTPGDMNDDHRLSVADVAWLIEVLSGHRTADQRHADLDEDGVVDYSDLQLLVERVKSFRQ